MSSFKLSTNASVVVLFALAAACVAYLAWSESPLASTVIPLVLTGAGGLAIQIIRQGATDVKVEEIRAEASAGTAQSKENGAQLAVIAPQVEQAIADVAGNTAVTNTTHALVNGQTEEFKQALKDLADQKTEIAEQRIEIALQKAELAATVELARTTMAELVARAEGVKEGREQMTGADTVVVEASAPVLILPPVGEP